MACEWTHGSALRLARGKKCGAAVVRQLLDLDAVKHVVPLMMPPANPKKVEPGDDVKIMGGALTAGCCKLSSIAPRIKRRTVSKMYKLSN